jgi:hypothetical protein
VAAFEIVPQLVEALETGGFFSAVAGDAPAFNPVIRRQAPEEID